MFHLACDLNLISCWVHRAGFFFIWIFVQTYQYGDKVSLNLVFLKTEIISKLQTKIAPPIVNQIQAKLFQFKSKLCFFALPQKFQSNIPKNFNLIMYSKGKACQAQNYPKLEYCPASKSFIHHKKSGIT